MIVLYTDRSVSILRCHFSAPGYLHILSLSVVDVLTFLNSIYGATIPLSVTSIMSQYAGLTIGCDGYIIGVKLEETVGSLRVDIGNPG